MASIFSVQNLHTFLRRKNLRPPSRGPPGPPAERKGRRSPPPLAAGRSLPLAGASPDGVGLVSSAMMLLKNQNRRWSLVVGRWSLALGRWPLALTLRCSLAVDLGFGKRPTTNDQRRFPTL